MNNSHAGTKKKGLTLAALLGLAAAAVSGGYFAGRARASGIPTTQALTYSGILTDATGAPLTGSMNIQISLFADMTTTTAACQTTPAAQTLAGGAFQIVLPDTCAAAVQANPNLFAEVFVNGSSLGRTKLSAAAYAIEAGEASCGPGVTGMIDTGAGFCIDTADRGAETAYASSINTCAKEGKVVCSLAQLCTALVRNVGGLSGTVGYRVSDLMFYPANNTSYFGGGGGGNPVNLPTACALSAPGPDGNGTNFRCCRGKG
jgi:hypothetical protein